MILSEGSVGSGVRRIEALTSGTRGRSSTRARELGELRSSSSACARRRRRGPRRTTRAADADAEVRVEAGVNVIVQTVEGLDPDELLDLSDRFKQRHAPAAVVLGSREDGKVHLVANFDDSVAERVSASDVVRQAAAIVGGGGGGRPTMARAGGRIPRSSPRRSRRPSG